MSGGGAGGDAGAAGSSSGAGAGGEGPDEPPDCGPGTFQLVGSPVCYECPGPVYDAYRSPYGTTCGMFGERHYDPATHRLTIDLPPGVPTARDVDYDFYDLQFDEPEQALACTGFPDLFVEDGRRIVVDASSLADCPGAHFAFIYPSVTFTCADTLYSGGYIYVDNMDGSLSASMDCHGVVGTGVTPSFSSLRPLPRPVRFERSGPGIVQDVEMHWSWEQRDDGAYARGTWSEAQARCADLDWADYEDWRLPNRFELSTIVDYFALSPAVDLEIFSGTPSEEFWSSTPNQASANSAFVVDFNTGVVTSAAASDTRAVRCVRGGPVPPTERYVVTPAGTVEDRLTGLAWQRAIGGSFRYASNAQAFCQESTVDGGGWRVPEVQELQSLLLDAGTPPLIDAATFPSTPATAHWSTTPLYGSYGTGWLVDFGSGEIELIESTGTAAVRCVR